MVKINLTARLKERLWYELNPRSLLFMVWGGGGGGEGSIHTYLLAMYSDDVFQSLTFFLNTGRILAIFESIIGSRTHLLFA